MDQEALLSPNEVIALAERESGAHDLTDADLRARIDRLIDWINARAPYSTTQVSGMRQQLQSLLTRRLKLALDRETLFATYSDAICVWPHRAPAETHVSMITISAVLYDAINGGCIDWRDRARTMAESVRAGLDHVLGSELVDDPRVIHLSFEDVVADPIAAVRKVYSVADLPYDVEFERRMQAWLADPSNRADRYGRYPYSANAFDLSEPWLNEQFADYRKRFGLQ